MSSAQRQRTRAFRKGLGAAELLASLSEQSRSVDVERTDLVGAVGPHRTDGAMNSDWCQMCQRTYSPGKPCDDCQRHAAIGVLVNLLLFTSPSSEEELRALDAVAGLLGNVTRVRRRHNREMRDEQRAAQRDARGAYDEGVFVGQESGRDKW